MTGRETHNALEPPSPAEFKPSQMPADGGGNEHSIRRLLYFLPGQCFICGDLEALSATRPAHGRRHTHRIVLSMNGKERNSDGQHRVHRRSVSVVSTYGRITPCRALHQTIEFIQVLDLAELTGIDFRISRDLISMAAEELSHIGSQGFRVCIPVKPRTL
jgi:hypothetical protein